MAFQPLVRRFVRASMEGWKDYLVNPAPANVSCKFVVRNSRSA